MSRSGARLGALSPLAVCCVLAGAVAWALRNDGLGSRWWYLLGPYFTISAALAWVSRGQPHGLPSLRYRRGDLSLGAAVAAALLALGWLVPHYLLPAGSEGRAWLFQVILVSNGIAELKGTVALVALVIMEEWVWRGWVQGNLSTLLPPGKAVLGTAILYCAIHLPTLTTLADPSAGLNPLLVVAALGLGGVLGIVRKVTGRLMPGIVAHLIFSYFGATWLLRI